MAIDPNKYKNIIFDLGGVILNIDYSLLIKSFAKIGFAHFEEYFSQKSQRSLFDRYEKGEISSDDFRKKIKEHCFPGTSDAAIDDAWNAMLLDLPRERLELLLHLKNHYRTFLLSNTNEIHIKFLYDYLKRTFQINDFSGHFEKVYLSYEIGKRKPDAEIFEKVLNENNLNIKETLFIDDSSQHIEGAGKLGLPTYWLDVNKESIVDVLGKS